MSYRTENALAFAPGMIFNQLDGGGMVIDRNTGEYVEADQVLKDPLHRLQLDCLDEGHLGCLKFVLSDDEINPDEELEDDEEPVDDGTPLIDSMSAEDDQPSVDNDTTIVHLMDAKDELFALIAAQEADMTSTRTTCTKGRHIEFATEKFNGRIHGFSHGFRGRQINKDRRLRAAGSGKTRACDAIW